MVKLGRPQITNLMYALNAAIRDLDAENLLYSIDAAATRLWGGLRRMGCNIVAKFEHSIPAVTTIGLPPGTDTVEMGLRLEEKGLLISYNNHYLHDRNWTQVCLMDQPATEGFGSLLDALQHILPAKQGRVLPYAAALGNSLVGGSEFTMGCHHR